VIDVYKLVCEYAGKSYSNLGLCRNLHKITLRERYGILFSLIVLVSSGNQIALRRNIHGNLISVAVACNIVVIYCNIKICFLVYCDRSSVFYFTSIVYRDNTSILQCNKCISFLVVRNFLRVDNRIFSIYLICNFFSSCSIFILDIFTDVCYRTSLRSVSIDFILLIHRKFTNHVRIDIVSIFIRVTNSRPTRIAILRNISSKNAARNSEVGINFMCVGAICIIQYYITRNLSITSNDNGHILIVIITDIINGYRTVSITINGAACNTYISSVAIITGIRIIRTTPDINSITNPCRATIIVILGHTVSRLGCSHAIDSATHNINLTHTSRDAAINGAAIYIQIHLTWHVNSFTLSGCQCTTINFKIHIARSVIASQYSVIRS